MILPDPSRSRAVIIGVSSYTKMPSLPTVRNNVEALRYTLTGSTSWNLPFENCTVVHDPKSPEELVDPILEAAEEATDTLLVYYAGHGMKGPNRGELRLTRATSRPGAPHTATHYDDIRDILLDSAASRRIVVLDCCYAASALGAMADPGEEIAEDALVEGTYLIAAAGETEAAMAQGENGFTVFTGELLKLLRNGLSSPEPMLLDLNTVFTQLDRSLRAKSRPRPRRRVRDSPGNLAIAWNRRWLEQQHRDAIKNRQDVSGTSADESLIPAPVKVPERLPLESAASPGGAAGGPAASPVRAAGGWPTVARGAAVQEAAVDDSARIAKMWPDVIEAVKNRRRFAWILLSQNVQPMSYDGSVLRLKFHNGGSRDTFFGADVDTDLKKTLLEVFGLLCEIEAVIETPTDGWPQGTERREPPIRAMRLAVGDEVSHESFGMGTVVSVSGEGSSAKATVDFDENGRKRLLLRYAPMRKI